MHKAAPYSARASACVSLPSCSTQNHIAISRYMNNAWVQCSAAISGCAIRV